MALEQFVWHSKPHKEELLTEQLELRRIETFYPCIRIQVVNSHARKVRQYFPGNVFVHVDLDKMGLSALHSLSGSTGQIICGGTPAIVSDGLICTIWQRVGEVNAVDGETFEVLKPGETVLIHFEPFEGYSAIFDTCLCGPASRTVPPEKNSRIMRQVRWWMADW